MPRILMMPFWYSMECVLKRHSNSGTFHFMDSIPVEVLELDDAAAPVVIRTSDHCGRSGFEMRLFDGELYGPVDALSISDAGNLHYAKREPILGIDAVEAAFEKVLAGTHAMHCKNYPLPKILKEGGDWTVRPERDVGDFRKILRDGRDAARAEAEHSANKALVLVDGQLLVREPEPRWVLHHFNIGFTEGGMPRWADALTLSRPHDQPAYGLAFRGDRLQDAIAYSDESIARYGRLVEDAFIADGLEWTWDDEACVAEDWARRMRHWVEAYGEQTIALSDEFLHAYMDLRRGMASGSLDLPALENLHDRLSSHAVDVPGKEPILSGLKVASETGLRWLRTVHRETSVDALNGFAI